MASFDKHLKGITSWNISAYQYLHAFLKKIPGKEAQFLRELCDAGFQQSLALAKALQGMEFLSAEDNSEEYENALAEQLNNPSTVVDTVVKQPYIDDGAKKDIDELLHIYNLEGKNDTTEQITIDDWYKRIFGNYQKRLPPDGGTETDTDGTAK